MGFSVGSDLSRFSATSASLLAVLLCTVLAGCATPIKPEDLAAPSHLTCINVPERLVGFWEYGVFKVDSEMYLERGPYLSEKEDAEGTYYRAPPGGVYVGSVSSRDDKAGLATHMNFDGGLLIPHDPGKPIRMYSYFSPESAPVVIPPEGANCSNAGYIADPSGKPVSLVSFMVGGALGGAAGRAIAGSGNVSYGQAAAGGALAGAIGAVLINMDVGKIVPGMEIPDKALATQIWALHAQAVPLELLPEPPTTQTATAPSEAAQEGADH